jgi:HEPN domain-containing protein
MIDDGHYKQLAEDLYKMLDRVSDFIDFDRVPLSLMEELDNLNQKYEEHQDADVQYRILTEEYDNLFPVEDEE